MKAKRKAKAERKTGFSLKRWVDDLFQPLPFSFVTQLPREVCVARLESLRKDRWWHSPKVYVGITRADDASCYFHVKRAYSTEAIEVNGYLHYWVGNQTCVCGKVSLPPGMRMPYILLPFGWLYFIFPVDICYLAFLVVFTLLGIIIDRFIRRHLFHKQANQLAKMIETMLKPGVL